MAPTETPKQPESSKFDDKPETAQKQSTDPSTTRQPQQTVNTSSELTDKATKESWNEGNIKVFMPVEFVDEREGSEESKK